MPFSVSDNSCYSKMLGHKRITTTQIYAKITNDKIGTPTSLPEI